MSTAIRIAYDSYVPASSNSPPLTDSERKAQNAIERACHLSALGFMLHNFQPGPAERLGDDEVIALRNYGRLVAAIADGLFGDIDNLEELLKAATTFGTQEETL